MRSFLNKAVLSAVAFAAISGIAHAQLTVLPDPGLIVPLTVTAPLGGTQIGATLVTPFTITSVGQGVTGNFYSAAYDNGGTYDFYYQVEVLTVQGGAGVTNIGVSDFSNFTTSVGYDPGANGMSAPFASGSNSPAFALRNGGTINFVFQAGNAIGAGERSDILVVSTNATTVVTSNGTVSNGAAANATILAPSAIAVPEANAGLLAGLALPLLGGVAVLRRKKK